MNFQAYAVVEAIDDNEGAVIRFEEPVKGTTAYAGTSRALSRSMRRIQRRMRQGEDWKKEHPEDEENELDLDHEPELFMVVERLVYAANDEQILAALKRAKKAYLEINKLDAEGRVLHSRQSHYPQGPAYR